MDSSPHKDPVRTIAIVRAAALIAPGSPGLYSSNCSLKSTAQNTLVCPTSLQQSHVWCGSFAVLGWAASLESGGRVGSKPAAPGISNSWLLQLPCDPNDVVQLACPFAVSFDSNLAPFLPPIARAPGGPCGGRPGLLCRLTITSFLLISDMVFKCAIERYCAAPLFECWARGRRKRELESLKPRGGPRRRRCKLKRRGCTHKHKDLAM